MDRVADGPGIEGAYDEGSAQRTQRQRSHPIEGPKETTPPGSLVRSRVAPTPDREPGGERSRLRREGSNGFWLGADDIAGQSRPSRVAPTPDREPGAKRSRLRLEGYITGLRFDDPAPVESGGQPDGIGDQREPLLRARRRTKINQQVATYNISPAAGAECTAEEAQQGLKDLFSIQQQALRWMEGLGNGQDAKRVGIADWHQQQYMPEQDRLEQRFLAQSDPAATLPELTDRTSGLGGKAASARARDRRFNGAGWEVINSETFEVTAEEGLTVYRMVNTTPEAPELVPSYDPRGPRSIRSEEPTSSDMMSYGHVYFAANKKSATSTGPIWTKGSRSVWPPTRFRWASGSSAIPEMPGGFRATTAMPDPVSVRTA